MIAVATLFSIMIVGVLVKLYRLNKVVKSVAEKYKQEMERESYNVYSEEVEE